MTQSPVGKKSITLLPYGQAELFRRRAWRLIPRFRLWTWALLLSAVLTGKMFWRSRAVWQPTLTVRASPAVSFMSLDFRGSTSWCPSPDGKWLAISTGQTVVIYDTTSGRAMRTIPMQGKLWKMILSSGARTLMTEDDQGNLRVIDVASGRQTLVPTSATFQNFGTGLTLSPDGTRLLIRTDRNDELWNCTTGTRIWSHPMSREACFTRDGRFVCCEGSEKVSFFDAADGTPASTIPMPHALPILGEAFQGDFSLDANHPLMPDSMQSFRCCRITPNGQTIAYVEEGTDFKNLLHVIDRKTGKDRIPPVTVGTGLEEIIFMPSGAGLHVIEDAGNQDGYTYVDLATGGMVTRNIPTSELQYPLESPDSRFIVCKGKSGLLILDARALVTLKSLPEWIYYSMQEFSPDGRRLLVMHNSTASLYDTRTWTRRSTRPTKDIDDAMFLPTGLILTRTGMDELTIWSQRRPDAWWGIVALWQFWLALLAAAAFMVSIGRDTRRWFWPVE